MKFKQLLFLLCFIVSSTIALSQVKVRGYYRKDGTNVRPHTRSYPGSGNNAGSNHRSTNYSNSNTGAYLSSVFDDTPNNASTRKYYYYEYRSQYYHIQKMLSVKKKRKNRRMTASAYNISNTSGVSIGRLSRMSDNVYMIYDSKDTLAGRVDFTKKHSQYTIYTPTGTKVFSPRRGGGGGIVLAVLGGIAVGVILGGL